MKFTIRDLLWLTFLAAVAVAWWVDRGRLANSNAELQTAVKAQKAANDWLIDLAKQQRDRAESLQRQVDQLRSDSKSPNLSPTNTRRRKMEQAQDAWLAEHRRLQADLWVFEEHCRSKRDARGKWTSPPSMEEKVFYDLMYFYQAALLNESDVSSYVPFMIERRGSLETVGAVGCLAALDQLLPLYAEQQKRTSEHERAAYWTSKESELERAAGLAEDANDFGRLLLAYAVRNRDKFGGVQPSEESRLRYEQTVQSALKSLGIPLD